MSDITRASSVSPSVEGESQMSRGRLLFVVASVLLGMLLAALDQTIVGTAMPRIIADLHGMQHYAWVFTSYMLASTVSIPIYGKLSDIYGRRIFFIGGMVIFLLGSALSGMSQTMTQLIIFRGLQGLGGGAMLPLAIAIIGDVIPPAERGKWQGLTSALFGLTSIIGPATGGWLTDNWGWRWVFYVNMPVGAVALVVAALALPRMSKRARHTVDYLGATALVVATVPLLLAFSWAGTEYPWGSSVILGLFAFSAVMLVVAFMIEMRAPEPIINPRLFQNRIFTVSVLATFISSAGMFGAIMYLPLFVQGVQGQTATGSGMILTPMMLGFVASSIIGGLLLTRTGRYRNLAIVSFGIAAFGSFLLSRMGIDTSNVNVVRNMVIVGLGLGATMSLFTVVVQNAFPFRQLGEVTAGLSFFRSIGGTIGVAVLSTIMNTEYQKAFQANVPETLRQAVPAEQLTLFEDPNILLAPEATVQVRDAFAAFGAQGMALFDQLLLTMRESLSGAITELFLISTLAMVLAMLLSGFLKEIPLRKTNLEAEPEPTATREALPEHLGD